MPIIAAILPFLTKALDLIPDPAARAEQLQTIVQALSQWDAQQSAVNQQEAQSQNWFVAGWRPWIGWTCGMAFTYQFVLQPFLVFVILAFGVKFDVKTLPVLDWSQLGTVLLGMLGLGGMRTIEKIQRLK